MAIRIHILYPPMHSEDERENLIRRCLHVAMTHPGERRLATIHVHILNPPMHSEDERENIIHRSLRVATAYLLPGRPSGGAPRTWLAPRGSTLHRPVVRTRSPPPAGRSTTACRLPQ